MCAKLTVKITEGRHCHPSDGCVVEFKQISYSLGVCGIDFEHINNCL